MDVDLSIMNHASILTVMEMGRIDFMVRCGFLPIAKQQGWFFPTHSQTVRYFKPLKYRDRGQLKTRILHHTDDTLYIQQIILKNDQPIATSITKGKIKQGRHTLPMRKLASIMQQGALPVSTTLANDLQAQDTHAQTLLNDIF